MNKKHLIYALITAIAFSSAGFANDQHERRESHHSTHQSKHRYNNRHVKRQEHRNHRRNYNNNHYGNSNAPLSTYGYSQPYRNNYNYRNRYRNKNYRHYKRHQNYNNNYRRYNNYNSYNSYNNYQPYYQSQYTYRPLRGLGHYFTDDYYGYGHWHDNNWCAVEHPQSYYFDYYSNYPYQDGWVFGDGDFGISFYFNY